MYDYLIHIRLYYHTFECSRFTAVQVLLLLGAFGEKNKGRS